MIRVLALLLLAAKPDAGGHPMSQRALRRPAQIDAEKFTAYGAEQEAEWSGHVRVLRDKTKITCDRLRAHYTSEQRGDTPEITDIRCDGHVEALDGDKRVQGQHADFDNETGILVITPADDGQVEIWDGKTHLWGRKATFRAGENRLEVEKPTTIIAPDNKLQLPAPKKDGGR